MKRTIFFLIFVSILLAPAISAFECSSLSAHQEICEYIRSSNASQEEQDYLISDIIDDLKNFPSHDFVRIWNLNVDTSNSPYSAELHDHGFIKNAWVKLLTIMPSFIEDEVLYTSSQGEALSSFGYDIVYPYLPEGNDCWTDYTTRSQDDFLELYVNGEHQDNGRLASYVTDRDSRFRVDYEITVWTQIDHYETDYYCCERDEGRCEEWCETCEYDWTEHELDRLRISDTLEAKYYNPETTASFEKLDLYSGTLKGKLDGEEHTSMHLDFPNSYFKEYNYLYSLIWSIPPYNILTVQTEEQKRTDFENLLFDRSDDYTIWVSGSNTCSLTYYNHFEEFSQSCEQYEHLDIRIDTDKLFYEEGEKIQVTILPAERTFNLTYAGHTYEAQGNIVLRAKLPYNKISITYNQRDYDKIIHVKLSSFEIAYLSFLFILLIYLIIRIIRNIWRSYFG